MPIFEFKCECCQEIFDKLTNNRDLKVAACPLCQALSKKIMSSPAFKVNGLNAKNGYSSSSVDEFIKGGMHGADKAAKKAGGPPAAHTLKNM